MADDFEWTASRAARKVAVDALREYGADVPHAAVYVALDAVYAHDWPKVERAARRAFSKSQELGTRVTKIEIDAFLADFRSELAKEVP